MASLGTRIPFYLLLLWLAVCGPSILAQEPDRNFAFGPYQQVLAGLAAPSAAVFDNEGRLYVAESATGTIRIYRENGQPWRRFGKWGDQRKRLREPSGLTFVDGNLWVSDRGNHRIQVFNRRGRYRRTVGEKESQALALFRPTGLAYHAASRQIAVADTGNGRVVLINPEGKLLRRWALGHGGKPLMAPVAVAFDPEGVLYVIDRDANRIERFLPDGTTLEPWGGYGPFFGLLDEPSAAVWHGQRLWVVDRRNHRLQGFQPGKGAVTIWGEHEILPHSGKGKLHYPDVLAISPSGGIAVVGEAIEHRLQVFTASENELLVRDIPPTTGMRDRTHFGSYLTLAQNLLLIPEPENHFVFVFDLRREIPIIINKFGERGESFGLLNRMAGLSLVPGTSEIACLDFANRRLSFFELDYDPQAPVRFDPNRVFFTWALDYAAFDRLNPEARPVDLRAVRPGSNGQLMLLDAANGFLFRFEPKSRAIHLVYPRHGVSRFRDPVDMAMRPDGKAWWITDRQATCVWELDLVTQEVRALGKRGEKRGRLLQPFGITATPKGGFLVTDSQRDRVLRFDKGGQFQQEWGGRGDRMGQFWAPKGIGTDGQGRIYVIDQGNHRAQMFSPQGKWLVTFGAGRAYNERNIPQDKLPLDWE